MNRRAFLQLTTAWMAMKRSGTSVRHLCPPSIRTTDVILHPLERCEPVEALEIRIGLGLVPMLTVDPTFPLGVRIRELRNRLHQEDLHLPLVRVRDDARIVADGFAILVRGAVVRVGRLTARELSHPQGHRICVAALDSVARECADELVAVAVRVA